MRIFIVLLFCLSMLQASDMKWSSDYHKALEKAKETKKDVYMLITSDACKWCRKFEKMIFNNSYVVEKLKEKYVLLHVSRDSDFIPEDFNTKRVPRHYFLTDKGENIYTFLGYWNKEDFLSFLPEIERKK